VTPWHKVLAMLKRKGLGTVPAELALSPFNVFEDDQLRVEQRRCAARQRSARPSCGLWQIVTDDAAVVADSKRSQVAQ